MTESKISGLKLSQGKRVAWMEMGMKEKIVATEATKRKRERGGIVADSPTPLSQSKAL